MPVLDDIEALLKRGHSARALALAKDSARRKPRDAALLDALARSYNAAGDVTRALASYDRLARLLQKDPKPLADKALLMQQTGDLAGAEAALRRALALSPLDGTLLRMLTATARLEIGDPMVDRFLTAWQGDGLPRAHRIQAGFALSAILGRDGMAYLHEANRLQRQAHPWSIDARRKQVADLQAAMSAKPWPDPGEDVRGRRPIFITGMPRSGTTLVEQILSRHPQVAATGETGLPVRAAYSILSDKSGFTPIGELSAEQLGLIGRRYLDGIDHFHHPEAAVFTDKSIQSYLVMGLLQHVMPEARSIVVRRDPRDIGLSIYRNHFEGGTHGYSNDLADIAHYMATMDDMVAFWRRVRPGSFIEITYEDLVRQPEPVIRRVLDYCGLEWNEDCLYPESNTGAVKTLSVAQVRAPINDKSVGGWRAYAEDLAPLIETLGDEVRKWD